MPQFCLSDGDHRLPLTLAPLHCLQFQDNTKVGKWFAIREMQYCNPVVLPYRYTFLVFFSAGFY